MKQNLKGIPETLLIPLWARAFETKQPYPIIRDEKAVEIMENIEYDFTKFDDEWPTQVSIAVRTELLDNATKVFIKNHPKAVIINIGCGLDTRFSRLDNGKIRWYDSDLPETIQVRKQFFDETDRYRMIAKSVFDYSWIDIIKTSPSVLIIAEGILMYFTKHEVTGLLNKLVESFHNAEMILETIPASLGKTKWKSESYPKTI